MSKNQHHHRSDLVHIAIEAMIERGLAPEFSARAIQQLSHITGPGQSSGPEILDLTALLWCSIDNDDSLDLDQLTVSQALAQGAVRIQVAIADVDALVKQGSAIDAHAHINTTTVYTSARIFPMLPERLSTDLTSLNAGQNRLALVIDMVFDADGVLTGSKLYRALVRNQAKLAYDAVSAWIDGTGALPDEAAAVPGMAEQLQRQDAVAQKIRVLRHAEGSLEFESSQPRAVFEGSRVVDLQQQVQNRARQLIEEFMIATNGCTARYLTARGRASIRRIVRSPERWSRIVAVAKDHGETLSPEPDPKALAGFLARQRARDPLRFQDLSLIIVKLLGSGEYAVETPQVEPVGHFGLAVRDYTHSTAPNRRYPDLITARLLKAALADAPAPYNQTELARLAQHCTVQEDAAQKVERQMRKSDAAMLLESRLGQRFDALVTGSTPSGVWVRIFSPPAEGKLVDGQEGLNVGDKLRVKLVGTDVERGFIDFVRVG